MGRPKNNSHSFSAADARSHLEATLKLCASFGRISDEKEEKSRKQYLDNFMKAKIQNEIIDGILISAIIAFMTEHLRLRVSEYATLGEVITIYDNYMSKLSNLTNPIYATPSVQ